MYNSKKSELIFMIKFEIEMKQGILPKN